MTNSLQGRLLIVATLVLALFLTLCGVALDRAYRNGIVAGIEEQLLGHVYGLLASAEHDPSTGRIVLPDAPREARFSRIESGLYAVLVDPGGVHTWQSASLAGTTLPPLAARGIGEQRFEHFLTSDDRGFFILSFGVSWEVDTGTAVPVTFVVAEDDLRYRHQVGEFRRSLLLWSGGAALLLLLLQAFILRWGLRPVRRAAVEINQIERGEREQLGKDYPLELRALTHNINAFIHNEKQLRARYRNTLGDLAHSLKTPLAVLAGMAEHTPALREQVDRMNNIVDYQLHRATSASQSLLHGKVAVAPILTKIIDSLYKVYAEKTMQVTSDVPATLSFYGERGDLYEILGNVLDNAFKYGRGRIRVSGMEEAASASGVSGLTLTVEDDGPGIPEHARRRVLQRGSRIDDGLPGQGIGLGVVAELVAGLGGELTLTQSELGGAAVQLHLPPTYT